MVPDQTGPSGELVRFVGGVGRSGTSIMVESLGCHPCVFPFWETRFICDPGGVYSYLRGRSTDVFKANMCGKFLQKINACFAAKKLDYRISQELMEAMLTIACSHEKEYDRSKVASVLMKLIFNCAKEASNKLIVVEKTPHTIAHLDLLYKTFGAELRYIHMIRDPLEVYSSQKRRKWVTTVDKFVKNYVGLTGAALSSNIPKTSCLVVDLGDIVNNPGTYMKEIQIFMGLKVAETKHRFSQKKVTSARNVTLLERALIKKYCSENYGLLSFNKLWL